jgi:hypothetical protein
LCPQLNRRYEQSVAFKRRAFHILIGTLSLLVPVMGYLIWQNFQSFSNLQLATMNRLQKNLAGHATAIGYCIMERKNDLRELVTGNMITAYFTNKSLGMS